MPIIAQQKQMNQNSFANLSVKETLLQKNYTTTIDIFCYIGLYICWKLTIFLLKKSLPHFAGFLTWILVVYR